MANTQISHIKQDSTTYDIKDVTSDNVRGTGTSGSLLKWSGSNTVTDGPVIGSGTTTFLRNDGTWATPTGTYTISVATNTALGGVKPWYYHSKASTGPTTGTDSTAVTVNAITTASGKYYAVESDSNGRLFVNVPWSNSDTKVNMSARGTSKAYLLASTTSPTSSAQAVTSVAETGVYLDTTAGKLVATSFAGDGSALTNISGAAISWGSVIIPYANMPTGTTASTVAAGDHTHTTTIAISTGTNQITLAHGGKYSITAGNTSYIFTMPASDNTDTKVTVGALTSGTKYYPILATGNGTDTRQIDSTLDSFHVKVTAGTTSAPGTAVLTLGNAIQEGTANNVNGQIVIYSSIYSATIKYSAAYSGNTIMLPTPGVATETNYLLAKTTANAVGSASKPVYFTATGKATEASSYAGGTAVTLNGTSKAASTASFYAPTAAGTSGQFLVSTGAAPSWKTVSLAYSLATTTTSDDTLVLPTSLTVA